jgi:hypothetical protein
MSHRPKKQPVEPIAQQTSEELYRVLFERLLMAFLSPVPGHFLEVNGETRC